MPIPAPVHEKLVDNNRLGTVPFIRFLNDISASAGDTTIVSNFTESGTITPHSQTILCDATGGDIVIKLPSPTASYSNKRSIKISISRIDNTINTVTIIPNDTELILGEASQYLDSGDVINLITNNTNWYLGACRS